MVEIEKKRERERKLMTCHDVVITLCYFNFKLCVEFIKDL